MDDNNGNFSEHYGYHIKYILASKLLLDDDFDRLYYYYDTLSAGYDYSNKYKFKKIVVQTVTVAGIFFLPLTNTCSSPAINILFDDIKHYYNRYRYTANLKCLINHFKNGKKINKIMVKFLEELLKFCENRCESIFKHPTDRLENFIYVVFREESFFLKSLCNYVSHFVSIFPEELNDFCYLENCNIGQFQRIKFENIKQCIQLFKDLNDYYILIVSHFLTCISMIMCRDLYSVSSDLENILKHCLPDIILNFDNINTYFNSTFNTFTSRDAQGEQYVEGSVKFSKLTASLQNTFIHSSIIVDQAFMLFKYVDKELETETFTPEVIEILFQLKSAASELNSQMDFIIKLYENTLRRDRQNNEDNSDSENVSVVSASTNRVNHDDPERLPYQDEVYELYIRDDNELPRNEYINDRNNLHHKIFIEMMNEELQRNDRFLEAQRQRGIVGVSDNFYEGNEYLKENLKQREYTMNLIQPLHLPLLSRRPSTIRQLSVESMESQRTASTTPRMSIPTPPPLPQIEYPDVPDDEIRPANFLQKLEFIWERNNRINEIYESE